MLKGYKLVI